MFAVVYISLTADFQKLLHNASSLEKKDNSAFEISRFLCRSYIFHLANRAKVKKCMWISPDLDC